MAIENIKEKLAQVVSKEKSKWLDNANYRAENKSWLNHSQSIAIKVLDRLDELGISQRELSERMGISAQQVSKILKGKENLTLESINKLETALGFELIDVPQLNESIDSSKHNFNAIFDSGIETSIYLKYDFNYAVNLTFFENNNFKDLELFFENTETEEHEIEEFSFSEQLGTAA